MENVVIIGGGIAGLTAAIYTARANLKPKIISGYEEGGQLMLTTDVENYPGFPDGIQGPELISNMKKQAQRFGAEFIAKDVEKFEVDTTFKLTLKDQVIESKSVIVATGASARWLGLESEKEYTGKGVSSCATCDGYFFTDREVIVVGGGDSACEEALFLTKFATKVTMIHRRDELRASKIMQDRVKNHEKIEIMWDSVVEEVLGDKNQVTGARVKNTKTGQVKDLKVDGFFVAIGHIPNTKLFKDIVELDEKGYMIADKRMQTNVKGLFAAGDVQDTIYRQAITAAGSGCAAAIEAERYIENS